MTVNRTGSTSATPEPRDRAAEETAPERRLVVDDYASQVHGEGARTQADVGGAPPAEAQDPRDAREDAEPG
jgi:hypothetical protein